MMDSTKSDIVRFYGLTSAGRNAFVTRFSYSKLQTAAIAMNELFQLSYSRFGP